MPRSTLVRRALFPGLLCLALLLACSRQEESPQARQTAGTPSKALVYQCQGGGGFTVEFVNDAHYALLTLNGQTLKLPQAISGSGARYSDGKTTLWIKGDGGFVEVDGQIILKDCQVKKAPSS
jgi:membrane-bound inhibitor of C-type lysozyme